MKRTIYRVGKQVGLLGLIQGPQLEDIKKQSNPDPYRNEL